MRRSIITGIGGQDGAYLSRLLLERGHEVLGVIRPGQSGTLPGLVQVGVSNEVRLVQCDLCSYEAVAELIATFRPDEVYNLAAQSSVSRSFLLPGETISFNTLSVLTLVRVIHECAPHVRMYQASSSDMFGKVPQLPIKEDMAFHPLSPYAVSKASAHWIAKNYRESFKLFIACGILFNHESPLRTRNFFVKKLICEALEVKQGKRETIRIGNLALKRDFGYAPRYVEAMYGMLQHDSPGDYLICSGRSVLLTDIANHICDSIGISRDRLVTDPALFRPLDIPDIYGCNQRARQILNWEYSLDFMDVLDILIEAEQQHIH
ncbi:GDP-D-mannose dehydratase [Desulfocurvibacter africanus PCS]|uniref:GDP-mannose 4,6-dehydratase n=1 Tax=Desulfocurvibacter africanus PCS TaxID=1262666 RepID=M5Q2F8_DESAF|nr:GDP-mannose 4,6-dehydratase [Desulfocurvibacter africanus]EMG38416.1 GDP-D-mannose dehydratase [Desulfocurvibacter africanus PCS]